MSPAGKARGMVGRRTMRAALAAVLLGSTMLLGGCIVVPVGHPWRPYHYGYWR